MFLNVEFLEIKTSSKLHEMEINQLNWQIKSKLNNENFCNFFAGWKLKKKLNLFLKAFR